MKAPKLFTAQELDPILESIINARFAAFLAKFHGALRPDSTSLEFAQFIDIAKRILRDAEIPQESTYAKIRNPRLTAQDLAWIWHNLDLRHPDEWETYDHHDHGADVGFTYHFHGATIYVDGYCLQDPWHGPEEIYSATLEDSLFRSYDLTPIIKEGRK